MFFVWFDSLHPINNISVMKGRVYLGWTSTKLGLMFLLKDTRQWRWWGSNPRSRVKHSTDWATALPLNPYCKIHFQFKIPSTKGRKFQKQSRPQGVIWYFHIHIGSGHFLRPKFWISLFLWFSEKWFLGMKICWIFWGVITKLDYI